MQRLRNTVNTKQAQEERQTGSSWGQGGALDARHVQTAADQQNSVDKGAMYARPLSATGRC